MATYLLHQYGMRVPPYISRTQARLEEAQSEGSASQSHQQRLEQKAALLLQQDDGGDSAPIAPVDAGAAVPATKKQTKKKGAQ